MSDPRIYAAIGVGAIGCAIVVYCLYSLAGIPLLTIVGVGTASHGHQRIKIKNHSRRRVEFVAKLLECVPPMEDFPLPVGLFPTHSQSPTDIGVVEPSSVAQIDVVAEHEELGPCLKLASNPPMVYQLFHDHYRIRIGVYLVNKGGVRPVETWFYVDRAEDGRMVLGANRLVTNKVATDEDSSYGRYENESRPELN